MNKLVTLIAGFIFPLVSNTATAITTLNTGPASTGKPVGVAVRNIWCVTENLSKKPQPVTAELWHANTISPPPTEPQRTTSYTLAPNQSSGYAGPGSSGPNQGGVQVYCRFKVKTKSARGYLTIEDDNATVLIIEAK
jgi:hypothetical protein